MIHVIEQGDKEGLTFVLLHGTGGDEYDLLPLGRALDASATLIGLRGEVSEQGMNRFFRRLSPGVFDEEDLMFRTKILKEKIENIIKEYALDVSKMVFMGYSNGANILANLLLYDGKLVERAVLMHPMLPTEKTLSTQKLINQNILITAGKNDRMVPVQQTKRLIDKLIEKGFKVEVEWFDQGHQITKEEVSSIKNWLKKTS